MLQDPIQTEYSGGEKFSRNFKNGNFTITPLSSYNISALVAGKKGYGFYWDSKIMPIDLALAWGEITKPEINKYIHYSQDGRWYYFFRRSGCPVDSDYIAKHSANVHIIPANPNILKAIKRFRKNDKVNLEGYLVSIYGTYEGREYSWSSSLDRYDSGSGACEIMYVTKVIKGSKIYK